MKKILLIIGLGTAFLAVSLWVLLSNGKCARAVKAKFRLGGALLTLTGMVTVGSCNVVTSCYDPAPSNLVYIEREGAYNEARNVKNGDRISIKVSYFSAYGIKVTIAKDVDNSEVLQSEIYKITDSNADVEHVVSVADYVGEAHLRVYLTISETESYEIDYLKLNVLE